VQAQTYLSEVEGSERADDDDYVSTSVWSSDEIGVEQLSGDALKQAISDYNAASSKGAGMTPVSGGRAFTHTHNCRTTTTTPIRAISRYT
jgi:hypothetical protein